MKTTVWPFENAIAHDKVKHEEIKRLEKVASSKIGNEENKIRDWKGNIKF